MATARPAAPPVTWRTSRATLAAAAAVLTLALFAPALHAQDSKSKPEAPSGKAIASATNFFTLPPPRQTTP